MLIQKIGLYLSPLLAEAEVQMLWLLNTHAQMLGTYRMILSCGPDSPCQN